MENKPKLYEVIIDGSEVTAISLVDEPAIEENFIYLSKQKPINLQIDEKHMLYGAALRPDFPIYRRDGDGEYYITFPKETVEKLSQAYIKRGFQRNITLDHNGDTNNVYVVESWIKYDMDNDKSIALGLDKELPIGTWFVGMKVEDDDVWKSIKNGERNGFSIESFLNLNEINFKKQNKDMVNDKENLEAVEITDGFWDKLREIISRALGKPQESKEVEDTVGEITDEIETEGGSKDEEPKVIEQAEETNPMIEEEAENVIEDINEISENNEEKLNNLQEIINKLNEEINQLKGEVETLKKDNETLKTENEELKKEPSAKPINVEASKHNQDKTFLDFAKGNLRLRSVR